MRILWLLLLSAPFAQAQGGALWGGLEPGPNHVGFQSFVALDPSHKYDGKARPILFDIWYPAADTPGLNLAYERYLRVPDVPVHSWFKNRLERFVRDVVAHDLFHKNEAALSPEERAAWEQLLATRTAAHLDASPLPGRFPVVLYHAGAGGSFEDNSVLFEYLASYGYVVVSSAFESPLPKFIGNNIGGVQRSGPDLDFMAKQAREWSYADAVQLGAIGHSAGAQNILQWIGSPKCPARAFVSLDTTMEYHPEDYNRHKLVRDAIRQLTPPRIPVLLFAQARLGPNFSAFDRYLNRTPHYEAEAAELSHDGFVTHGFLGRVLTRTPDADAVRRSYEEVCRTVRAFLDASLKADAQAAHALQQAGPTSPVSVRYQPTH